MSFAIIAATAAVMAALLSATVTAFAHWRQPRPASALLVIAHPDDEAMFFTPTLRSLRLGGAAVYILCLSGSGGSPSAGRAEELRRSAATLGVPPDRVTVLSFRDGMQQRWDVDAAAAAVSDAVAASAAALVISFDAGGVTGHPNHAAVAAAVLAYASRAPNPVPCYALETVGLLRRLVGGVADVALSAALHALAGRRRAASRGVASPPPELIVVTAASPLAAHTAMRQHASQFVWYRWLHVWLSRYPWVNSLQLLRPAA